MWTWSLLLLVLGTAACTVAAILWPSPISAFAGKCVSQLTTVGNLLLTSKNFFYYVVITLGLLPVALLLEHLIPARAQQSLLSAGLAHDAVWYVAYPVFKVVLFAGATALLASLYANYLGFLRVDAIHSLSVPAQVVTVVAATDFLAWLHHLVRHKVPVLWEFHKIHHSQRELNYFSDLRVHPVDYIAAQVILFVPFNSLSLDLAIPTFVGWQIFKTWHTRFCHANIRTSLGLLRYVFVSPQSHRIHHSSEPEHADKNFGVIFSIWDWAFRTQYTNFDRYPATGISDGRFPIEMELSLRSAFFTPLRQLYYPFARVFQSEEQAQVTGSSARARE